MMMRVFAVIILSAIAINPVGGAMNLKIFKDPKDVVMKRLRPPWYGKCVLFF